MDDYDVVVVGARCAGAATARLLAQSGVNVLVVDRAEFRVTDVRAPAAAPAVAS
jgi:flavin-dependent dehydrogenase